MFCLAAINRTCFCFYNMSLRLRSSVYGGVPEWPKGTDCKSAASSFGGSNPPSSTSGVPPQASRALTFVSARRFYARDLHSRVDIADKVSVFFWGWFYLRMSAFNLDPHPDPHGNTNGNGWIPPGRKFQPFFAC